MQAPRRKETFGLNSHAKRHGMFAEDLERFQEPPSYSRRE